MATVVIPTKADREEWSALADAMARIAPNIDSVKIIRRFLAALERVEAERDELTELMRQQGADAEKLGRNVLSLSAERDALREENARLKAELEELHERFGLNPVTVFHGAK